MSTRYCAGSPRRIWTTWIERLAPDAQQDPLGHLAMAVSHPRWIVSALDEALAAQSAGSSISGGELEAALRADDQPPAVHLVARPGRIERDELLRRPADCRRRYSRFGVYLEGGDPGAIRAVADGRAAVQDEGSQLVATALAMAPLDGPDLRWLDLAAGPGGKAGLLGALAAERGADVDAVEITPHRAELVRQTVRGLPVTVHTADGRDPGLPPASFDRVMLDAPCTGLGALRRRPEARWRRQPSDVAPTRRTATGIAGVRGQAGASGRGDRLCDVLAASRRDRRGDRPTDRTGWS